MANTPNNPRDFRMKIKATSETAFQRAIWGCETSVVDGTTITWIDIEIPVDRSGNPRGKCIDLVGKDNNGHYVLCELKFGSPGNGNPEKAIAQILSYQSEVQKNADCIGHHKRSEKRGIIDWRKVASTSTRLIVAANTSYWEYWQKRHPLIFPTNVECYKLKISNSHFKDMKSTNVTYEPSISDEENSWEPVVDSED